MIELKEVINTVICGDALSVLKNFPSESVNCVITSPPYWGLRDYGIEPVIWDGVPECEHEWGEKIISLLHKSGETNPGKESWFKDRGASDDKGSQFCSKCGAWKGSLGLEPTFELYIKHLCDIFDEVKRVLRKDGTCFVNLGDSYASNGGALRHLGYQDPKYKKGRVGNFIEPSAFKQSVLPKSLCLIPFRFAIEMVNRGWICRNVIIWHKCLEENTLLFVRKKGKYALLSIKELYADFDDTFMLTQDMQGKQRWVKIKNILYIGKRQGIAIVTKSGREVISTEDHKFVVKQSSLVNQSFRKIKLKKAIELSTRDYLYVNSEVNIKLQKANALDYKRGFLIGFFLAEGSYIKTELKPYKDNKFSLYARRRWGIQKRGEKIVGIQLSCGISDLDRGYISILEGLYNFRFYTYDKSLCIQSRDKQLLLFIQKFVAGEYCDGKHLTQEAFNQSSHFLEGIIKGFLAGDGHYEPSNKRWRVGIKPNSLLKSQIEFICRILHYDFRYYSTRKIGKFEVMSFSIRTDSKYRTVNFGCNSDKIDKIEPSGECNFYDIEVEPIYFGGKGNNQYKQEIKPTTDKRKAKYNNLYFLANGIWTHNSNCMPSSAKDRCTVDFEYLFFFVRSPKYWYEQQFQPIAETTIKRSKNKFYPDNPKTKLWYSTQKAIKPGRDAQTFNEEVFKKIANGEKMTANKRCVWTIPTKPFPEAHFATFPPALIETPMKAGCPEFVCKKCGKARTKIIDSSKRINTRPGNNAGNKKSGKEIDPNKELHKSDLSKYRQQIKYKELGYTDCGCNAKFEPGICLDPFMGAGTTALVALKQRKRFIGIEMKQEYIDMANQRIKQIQPNLF